mgnify:CR=1 FL=1
MANNALAPMRNSLMLQFAQPISADTMDFTDKYNTPLTAKETKEYQAWLQTLPEFQRSTRDYDLQGAFKAGLNPAENGHFPDTFKKPNHPTFSNQSKYHGVEGYMGGNWIPLKNGQWAFAPGVSKVRQPIWDQASLQDYFARVEPNSLLLK